jgi:hypothetical protein
VFFWVSRQEKGSILDRESRLGISRRGRGRNQAEKAFCAHQKAVILGYMAFWGIKGVFGGILVWVVWMKIRAIEVCIEYRGMYSSKFG